MHWLKLEEMRRVETAERNNICIWAVYIRLIRKIADRWIDRVREGDMAT